MKDYRYLLLSVLLACLVVCLVACGGGGGGGGGGNAANPGAANRFVGVWTSQAYGRTFDIGTGKLSIYQHGGDYCLLQATYSDVTEADLALIFELAADGQSISDPGNNGTPAFHAPATIYTRSAGLPDTCSNAIPVLGRSGYVRDPARDFEIFWQTFSEFYLSFALKGVDWEEAHAQFAPLVSQGTSDPELFEILFEMIAPLRDSHVQISSPEIGVASVDGKPTLVEILVQEYLEDNGISGPLSPDQVAAANAYIGAQLERVQQIIDAYAQGAPVRNAANGQLNWYVVDNIGYLQIRAMTGFAADEEDEAAQLSVLESALDAALAALQDTAGLVVDVRTNNGGMDFLSMAIASRFVATDTHVYSKQARAGSGTTALVDVYLAPRGDVQYLQPVVLLTSASTVSAAEVFTLMLRALPQVTLMGESTQGALSDMLQKHLPNGFEFGLANEYYYSVDGEWFEDVGIPVAVEVPVFTRAQRDSGVDSALAAAFARLRGEG